MRFLAIATILLTSILCQCLGICPQGGTNGNGGGSFPPPTFASPGTGASPAANPVGGPSSSPPASCTTLAGIVVTQTGSCPSGSSAPPAPASSSPIAAPAASTPPVALPAPSSQPASGSPAVLAEITFYNTASSGNGLTSDGVPTVEGSGAYADPITFATAPIEIPDKALVYVKGFNKYFIHTDTCVQCETDWANGTYHLDLWVGADPANCAITWGVLHLPVVLNPPATLPVSSAALDNGQCFPLPSPLPTS
jgi:hypothetical protein